MKSKATLRKLKLQVFHLTYKLIVFRYISLAFNIFSGVNFGVGRTHIEWKLKVK